MAAPTRFFVCLDWGKMGGDWCRVNAESPDAITSRFPWLFVFPERPDWMTADTEVRLPVYSVEDPAFAEFAQRES